MSAKTKIERLERTGRSFGSLKTAAKRIGMSFELYTAMIKAGMKWCTKCKVAHLSTEFKADRSRGDGLSAKCVRSRASGHPRGWHEKPRINPKTGRPGPIPKPGREGDKKQARSRVNHEVADGRRANPNNLPCVDCGHTGSDKRHKYDHYMGYSTENHMKVEAVCTTCHHKREDGREWNQFPESKGTV